MDITDLASVPPGLFHDIVEHMPQIVWVTRPDGFHEYYNRAWFDFTGLDYHTSRGGGWNLVLHPEDRQRAIDRWNLSLTTGELYEIEYRFKRASDGKYIWFLGRALPLRDASGQITRWFGTCTDIHAQKSAEEVMRDTKEALERAGKSKDEFLATVSHELRTPLNAILGWTQLMQMGLLGPDEFAAALAKIENSAKTQAQLVEDLLDVSRIINNKLRLVKEPLDLRGPIQRSVETVAASISAAGLDLRTTLPTAPVKVIADSGRIQQAVTNLLTNAVKFTPIGGRVEVELRESDGCAHISVTDTGAGIDPQQLPRIFDRFHQAHPQTRSTHSGLGLGLAIVRHLIELHGGEVHAHSDGAGHGARFEIKLPLLSGELPKPGISPGPVIVQPPPTDSLVGISVLLIEDERCTGDLLATTLRKVGAEVRVANDADDGLRQLLAQRPDVLISDIALPGEDGYDLIASAQVPGIPLPPSASHAARAHAFAAGFSHYVSKPAEPADLIRAVARLSGAAVAPAS